MRLQHSVAVWRARSLLAGVLKCAHPTTCLGAGTRTRSATDAVQKVPDPQEGTPFQLRQMQHLPVGLDRSRHRCCCIDGHGAQGEHPSRRKGRHVHRPQLWQRQVFTSPRRTDLRQGSQTITQPTAYRHRCSPQNGCKLRVWQMVFNTAGSWWPPFGRMRGVGVNYRDQARRDQHHVHMHVWQTI